MSVDGATKETALYSIREGITQMGMISQCDWGRSPVDPRF